MSEFQREERYIVVKLKKLSHMQERHLRACLHGEGIKTVESVVVEHDWPEYRFVWMMLEHRMSGAPIPDFNTVRTTAELDAERLRADTAVAEVAALREELAETADDLDTAVHHNIDLQLKNAEALKLLHMSKEILSTISLHRTMAPNDWCDSFKSEVADRLEKLRNALQPTESGASE